MNEILEIAKRNAIACISLALNIITLVAGFVAYVRFDRRIKKQQVQLNEIALLKARSANVIALLDPTVEKGKIFIKNDGEVAAENVTVCVQPDIRAMPRQFPFPMRMEAGQRVGVSIIRSLSEPETLSVKVSWRDEARQNGVEKSFDIPLFS